MVQKSQTTTWDVDVKKNLQIMGYHIKWLAGFFHQQYLISHVFAGFFFASQVVGLGISEPSTVCFLDSGLAESGAF